MCLICIVENIAVVFCLRSQKFVLELFSLKTENYSHAGFTPVQNEDLEILLKQN